MQLISRAELWN